MNRLLLMSVAAALFLATGTAHPGGPECGKFTLTIQSIIGTNRYTCLARRGALNSGCTRMIHSLGTGIQW